MGTGDLRPSNDTQRRRRSYSAGRRCAFGPFTMLKECAPDAAQRHKRVYARLRRAMALAKRCAAEPGPLRTPAFGTVPALRSGMKKAAPRPGHGSLLPLAGEFLHRNAKLFRLHAANDTGFLGV